MTEVVGFTNHSLNKGLVTKDAVRAIVNERLGRWFYDKKTEHVLVAYDAAILVLKWNSNSWALITVYNHGGSYPNLKSDRFKELSDANE